MFTRKLMYAGMTALWTGFLPLVASGAPSVADALKLAPVQPGIQYDTPSPDEVEKCTIKAEKSKGVTAWVIRGPDNLILREFADSNANNVVDTWSYYRNGLEVYRDIDSDHNGKADQYRWFNNDGTRWGIDRNEDGKINYWKLISPEEVAEEVVEALQTKDLRRFSAVLISKEHIQKLGLSKGQAEKMVARVESATEAFRKLAADFSEKDYRFSDFGGLKPGMVPAGTEGLTKDLMVYETVWAMVQNDEAHQQLQLGTMVSVDGSWRLIDGPSMAGTGELMGGFFYDIGGRDAIASAGPMGPPDAVGDDMQRILSDIEKIDQQLATAKPADKPKLNEQRAEKLFELAGQVGDQSQREQWLKQLADMVSAATQEGSFPKGIEYLEKLQERLRSREESEDTLAYFEFNRMFAEYFSRTLSGPDVDYLKAQEQWLKDLEAFVDKFPDSENSVEALRQLAMGHEMSDDKESAVKWYRRILEKFPKNAAAPLAKGAIYRLTSEGRAVALQGNAIDGSKVDLRGYRGKVVAIQYWTTSCEVCKRDQQTLKELIARHRSKGFEVIGVNLDYSRDALVKFLQANKLPWKQLYESGGFESRLATEMGIVTVPLIMLVDKDGKVVNPNVQGFDLEDELKKLLGEAGDARAARR